MNCDKIRNWSGESSTLLSLARLSLVALLLLHFSSSHSFNSVRGGHIHVTAAARRRPYANFLADGYANVNVASLSLIPPSIAQISALQDLYESCDGKNWDWNSEYGSQWNFTAEVPFKEINPCAAKWQGIACNCVLNNNTYPSNIYRDYYYDDSFETPSESSANCTIEMVSLSSMNLDGTIPESVGNLTDLISLHLTFNDNLRGTIPINLWELRSLEQLYLSSNKLNGTFPSEIGKLSNLTHLAIVGTLLSGSIPPQLFQLTHLEHLYLGGSTLISGDISASLTMLSELQVLSIVDAGNILGSSFPSSVLSLTRLHTLELSGNHWHGSHIPKQLFNLKQLNSLILFRNHLSGNLYYYEVIFRPHNYLSY